MSKTDTYEQEILEAYEHGQLMSVATKDELARFKAASRATALMDRRVNVRLSSADLQDIRARALEEGIPYQTLIASVLHKYVTGLLTERPAPVVEEGPDGAAGDERQAESAVCWISMIGGRRCGPVTPRLQSP